MRNVMQDVMSNVQTEVLPLTPFSIVGSGYNSAISGTRASTGTAFQTEGVLKTYAINELRQEYDTSTGALKGLLIEEARTNQVPYSGEATQWGVIGATATNLTTFWNGMEEVAFASNGASWHRSDTLNNYVLTAGLPYAVTCFYRAGTSGKARLNIRDNTTTTEYAYAGVIGSLSTSDPELSNLVEELVDSTNGVYRATFVYTPTTSNNHGFSMGPDTNIVGEDIVLLGMQVEQAASASSFIFSGVSTTTRSADIASLATSPWYNDTEGTFVVEFTVPVADSKVRRVLRVDAGGSGNERIHIARDAANSLQYAVVSGGSQVVIQSHSVNPGDTVKFAAAYKLNNSASSLNGSSPQIDTTCVMPTGIDGLGIGTNPVANSEYLNEHIKSITYYPTRLSNAQLQALTS